MQFLFVKYERILSLLSLTLLLLCCSLLLTLLVLVQSLDIIYLHHPIKLGPIHGSCGRSSEQRRLVQRLLVELRVRVLWHLYIIGVIVLFVRSRLPKD